MSALGVVGVLGNLLGGGLEQYGAAVQSHRGRQFAREMAGTQYQRAVADMKAAGLNPMAIFGNGGGSPAAVAQGSFSNPAEGASRLGDELVKGFSVGAQNDALRAQADIARATARATESEADLKLAENSALRAALDSEGGRLGLINQRYGTLGAAGEVLGGVAAGAGNVLGGDHSAKSVAAHESAKEVVKGPPSRDRLRVMIEDSKPAREYGSREWKQQREWVHRNRDFPERY